MYVHNITSLVIGCICTLRSVTGSEQIFDWTKDLSFALKDKDAFVGHVLPPFQTTFHHTSSF
jgi:hypothetical protein